MSKSLGYRCQEEGCSRLTAAANEDDDVKKNGRNGRDGDISLVVDSNEAASDGEDATGRQAGVSGRTDEGFGVLEGCDRHGGPKLSMERSCGRVERKGLGFVKGGGSRQGLAVEDGQPAVGVGDVNVDQTPPVGGKLGQWWVLLWRLGRGWWDGANVLREMACGRR